MKIYLTMAEKFPRAQCPKRLPLNFLTGLYLKFLVSLHHGEYQYQFDFVHYKFTWCFHKIELIGLYLSSLKFLW